jgi:2-methylisocitrate lyase-like PEP mutase family enzyme
MKVIEVHSGLSALLAEKSSYDAVWVSSLTHAAINGLPDNELVPLKERVDFVQQVSRVTNKPIIVDIDTGGDIDKLPFLIRWFEKAGAYAVIMEDKKGVKKNSLLEDAKQEMEDVDVFSEKIRVAKANVKEMKVFARLESLIAKRSVYDAMIRAEAYIHAGADGIMVHSKEKVKADEVMEVGNEIRLKHPGMTLIAVPTTYVLPENHCFDIVIHANHLLRVSMKAMVDFLDGKDVQLTSVQEIFDLIGQ